MEISIDEEDQTFESESSKEADDYQINLQNEFEARSHEGLVPRISKTQVLLWKQSTHMDLLLKLWFEKFENKQRVALWNALKFPRKYYEFLLSEYTAAELGQLEDLFEPEEVKDNNMSVKVLKKFGDGKWVGGLG